MPCKLFPAHISPHLRGQMGSNFFGFISISTLLPFMLSFVKVNPQIQGCSLMQLDLQHCLNPSANPPFSFDSCCITLNQAIQVGYHCLCSLLSPSNHPFLSMTLSLSFSSCYLSVPPLTRCNVVEPNPVLAPPADTVPVRINQPPPIPVLPSPDLPSDGFVPTPPKMNDIALNGSERNHSSLVDAEPVESSSPLPKMGTTEVWDHSSSNSVTMKTAWHSRIFLLVILCAYIAKEE